MKITELNGLFVAYDSEADFRILIAANDREEALAIAIGYFSGSGIWEDGDTSERSQSLEIAYFENPDLNFDCDYIITKDQEVPSEHTDKEPFDEWLPSKSKEGAWSCPRCFEVSIRKTNCCAFCGRRNRGTKV